jgi:quinol monooxygenase YgiN
MSTVNVLALIKVKPGAEDEAVALLTPVVEQSHREPGCVKYTLQRSTNDPQQFAIVEQWRSQADLDEHFLQPYVGSLMTDAADLLAEAPVIHFLTPCPLGDAGKGVL